MLRSALTAISIVLLTCTCVQADEYLLRLATTGYRDRPQHEKQPAQEILESIETVARVGQNFYGNSTIGSEKISIDGKLEQLKDGRFRVLIRYRKSTDLGESVAGPNGQKIPITKSTNIDTTAIVELEKTTELGMVDGSTRTKEGKELKSKTQSLLSLVKFDPARN